MTDLCIVSASAGSDDGDVPVDVDKQILTAELEREGRTARIVVVGAVDLTAGPVLATAAGRLHPSHDHVVLDLRGVTFLDVAGFDELLRLRDQLLAVGCRTEFDTAGTGALVLEVMQQAHLQRSPFHTAAD